MSVLAKAIVYLNADITGFESKMNTVESRMVKVGQSMTSLGRSLSLKLSLPLVTFAGLAVKTAADFDTSIRKMGGLVGIQEGQLQQWRGEIRNVAEEFGSTAGEAADAMFYITSAGLRGSQAMEALTASLKGTVIGMGDTKTIADAATSAMNAYKSSGLTATRATEILAAAVREGKLEASTLAPEMGRLTGTASALGISFDQVAGTLAAFSRTGTDASEGATELLSIMSALLGKSDTAKKALKGVGLSFEQLRETAKGPGGLVQVMRILNDAFKGNVDQMALVIPNIRAFRGIMNILAQDAKDVDTILMHVTNSQGLLDEALIRAQGPGEQLRITWAQLKDTLIAAGNVIIPILVPALQKLSLALQGVARWLENTDPTIKKIIVGFGLLLAGIGPVLIIVGAMAEGLAVMLQVVVALIPAVTTLGGLLGATGILAVGGVIAGILASQWIKMRIEVEKTTKAMKDANAAMDRMLGKTSAGAARKLLGGFEGPASGPGAGFHVGLNTKLAQANNQRIEDERQLTNVTNQYNAALKSGNLETIHSLQARKDALTDQVETDKVLTAQLQGHVDALQAVVDADDEAAAAAKKAADEAARQAAIAKSASPDLDKFKTTMAEIRRESAALGDSFDVNAAQIQAYSTVINALVAKGADLDKTMLSTGETLRQGIETYRGLTAEAQRWSEVQSTVSSALADTITPAERFETTAEAIHEVAAREAWSNERLAAALEHVHDAYVAATPEAKAYKDRMDEVRGMLRDIQTAQEQYAHTMDLLDEAVATGVINWDQYWQLVDKATAAMKSANEMSDQLKQGLVDLTRQAVDNFVNMATTGKESFKDFVDSAIADVTRLILKLELLQLLAKIPGFGSLFGGGGGGEVAAKVAGTKATGGFVGPGALALVGEAGPEIISGGRSGVNVTPLTGPYAGHGGAGGMTEAVSVNVQVSALDAQGVADFVENNKGALANAVLAAQRRSRALRNRMGG